MSLWQLLGYGSIYSVCYLFFGNILMFLPLGIYLRYRGLSVFHAALFGCTVSAAIEAAQYVLGSGLTEVEDVILNTLGTVLGALLFRMLTGFQKKV